MSKDEFDSVVDQDPDPAKRSDARLDHVGHVGVISDVDTTEGDVGVPGGGGHRLSRLSPLLFVDVSHEDFAPAPGQLHGDGEPDPLGRTCHDASFASHTLSGHELGPPMEVHSLERQEEEG